MISGSTLQLLRFSFSLFLLPVYLFALSEVPDPDPSRSVLIFIILHLLVYPASNGYNSYMDRDTTSIGGVKNPLPPTKQLYYTTLLLDLIAVLLSLLISVWFTIGIIVYITSSRAYSYRGIRLKKYPVIGYLIVVLLQGGLIFFLTFHGAGKSLQVSSPWTGILASSLLIGGFYPLTQIYQHTEDKADGVRTISMLLGYRGTFIFSAAIYLLAISVLYYHFLTKKQLVNFFILATVLLPILVYFIYWMKRVWNQPTSADFRHTMQMNILAAICTNSAFLILLIRRFI
ncbi:MAG TPA: UbiA family prenyltransferase [Flavitalea sp.]|nr:UbiA family prenyltransferase [Flavitalea sp.]